MDVRLPDGTIVRNVPDNITQEDLMDRVGMMRQPSQGLTGKRLAEVGAREVAPLAAAAGVGGVIGGPAGAARLAVANARVAARAAPAPDQAPAAPPIPAAASSSASVRGRNDSGVR